MGNSEVLTTAEIRKLNCEKIFAYIYQSRRTSKQTIAQVMGLSMPTVTQNLKVLEHLGLIERNGFYESTGGRKAQMIHCIQDARIAIGAAVLQEGLSLCAVGLCAQIIKEEQHPLPFQNTDRYYREVGRLVTAFAGGLPYPSDRILGIGIAIQGLVSPDGEQVIYGSILQNTGTTRQSFQAHLPFPCRLLHDTDAAAAAEFWHNEELRDAVYLVLNRNLGGALVIGGEIRCGWGIIEHMTLVPGGKPCYCGRLGCAEAYCSANSLRQASGLPFELFFQQLRAGNAKCAALWEDYLRSLAQAVDNIRMLVNCPFMIGGFLQQFMTEEDFRLLTRFVEELTSFPEFPVSFVQGRHGCRASMLGAAICYVDAFLKNIDPVQEPERL
ncbi:MAG: ROK family transcriptional regulator [Lawsonibacter sp.]|nr:ROK family transcriptional regulator [Lawsonibacter sp.]